MRVWSDDTMERAQSLVASYPDPRSAVMPLLYLAMREEGGPLTDDGMRIVSDLIGYTPVQVQAVASFYTMYKRHVGRHLVSVCTSISCHLLGGDEVLAAAADEVGVPVGGTAADESVTVEGVECIGACGGAVAVQVDYEFVEGVTAEAARSLCRWLVDESPETVRSDDMQERFGGRTAFDWGSEDPTEAVGPMPAFGPYGSAGGA
jgi:NADH-quinone oxidoreductase subunit E